MNTVNRLSIIAAIFCLAIILLASNANFLFNITNAEYTTYPLTVGMSGSTTPGSTISGKNTFYATVSSSVYINDVKIVFKGVYPNTAGEKKFSASLVDMQNWHATVDTALIADGSYTITAIGSTDFGTTYSYTSTNSFNINVLNGTVSSPSPTPTPIYTHTPLPTPTPTPVLIIDSYPTITSGMEGLSSPTETSNTITGIKYVWANSNLPLTSLKFYLKNTSTYTYASYSPAGTTTDYKTWSTNLDTTKVDNGGYTLMAKGYYNDILYVTTTPVDIYINNGMYTIATMPNITVGIEGITSGTTISGMKKVWASSDSSLNTLTFKLYNTSTGAFIDPDFSVTSSDSKYWFAYFDTTKVQDGSYNISAKGYYGTSGDTSSSLNNVYFNIDNITEMSSFAPSPTLMPTPSPTPVIINNISTPTPTPTPISTPTPTIIATPTPSPSPWPTSTPGVTPSVTVSISDGVVTNINGIKKFLAVSTVSLNKLSFYFDDPYTLTTPDYQYDGYSQDKMHWSIELDTGKLKNVNYYFYAKGFPGDINGNSYYSMNTMYVSVLNGVATPLPSILPYPSPQPSSSTTPYPSFSAAPFSVRFNEIPDYVVNTDRTIYAETSTLVDYVKFSITGPKYTDYAGVKESDLRYKFTWYIGDFPAGVYTLKVTAVKGYDSATNQMIIKIDRPVIVTSDNTENISNASSVVSVTPVPTANVLSAECKAMNFLNYDDCQAYMSAPEDCRVKGLYGDACGNYMATPWECRQQNITDKNQCQDYMFKNSLPTQCRDAKIYSPEECSKKIFSDSLPTLCKDKNIISQEECNNLLATELQLTSECRSANIVTYQECDIYMVANFMPKDCKEKGITTMTDCDYLLRNRYGNFADYIDKEISIAVKDNEYFGKSTEIPLECKALGITDSEKCYETMFAKNVPEECKKANIDNAGDCEKHLQQLTMPNECREQKIVNIDDCKKLIFKKNAPKECIDAEIFESKKCEDHMFVKYAPSECKDRGIKNAEACKKYMFDKFGDIKNISKDKIPVECQKAETKTSEECAKIIKKAYLPQECQDQGVANIEQCNVYFQQKYMPKDCRDKGASSMKDCDRVMFEKYGPEECIKAGVKSGEDCKNFLFNKYIPKVQCQGVDNWQCKNAVKEDHLGGIVGKQALYETLKEKAALLVGKSVKAGDLTKQIPEAADIIPVQDKSAALKVVSMEDKVVFNDNNEIVQTPPIAIMLDIDGDGLPDDVERRLGTDQNKTDTDADGYSDSEEIKNGYDPLGSGKLNKEIAPIEQAITQNMLIGQPKSDGQLSDDLKVNTVVNMGNNDDGTVKGYVLAGKAEPNSVVTLYVYSDMPLLITAKTDEYGNWKYELSKSLNDGEHEAYVVVNDNTGKVVTKSSPLSFFVKEAKAVSAKDFTSSLTEESPTGDESSSMGNFFIITALLIIVGLTLFILFIKHRAKQVGLNG